MEPTFGECIQKGFAGYCDYSNRSRRREYWYFALIVFLYELVINVVIGIIQVDIVTYIGYLLMAPVIVFTLPLAVRRLHDTGRTGWWLLLILTGIGSIVILVFVCLDSDPQTNEYGPSPKYSGSSQAGLTES